MATGTTIYGLQKPTVGADADVWGSHLNNNLDDTEALLSAITTTGSANAYLLTTGLSLAAYVSGQSFIIKPNHANTGAATINVDGLGAKDLRKNGTTALASGDLATDQYYRIAYNGTQFQIVGAVTGLYQPLDATLTALAALSWSSGSSLLQFTAADTVSLTLAPSVSSVTASQGGGATVQSGSFINTTDNATVRALKVGGARATPANNDASYISYVLNSSTGVEREVGRVQVRATTITNTSEASRIEFQLMSAGSLATHAYLQFGAFVPNTNDLAALGTTAIGWSDLHLATGGVINWANGLITLTHDATNDRLVLAAGSLKARPSISTDTGGTLTSASDNCIVDLATAPTINDGVHEAGSIIVLVNNTASAMTITQDTGMTLRLHGTTTTGNRTLNARGIATVQIDPVSNAEAIVTGDVS